MRRLQTAVAPTVESPGQAPAARGPREPLRVLGHPVNGLADEVALAMLSQAIDDLPVVIEMTNMRLLPSELVALLRKQDISVICLADLPPSLPTKARYLVKHLRSALPDLRILVGRWSPPGLADESTLALREAGATLVTTTIVESRAYLGGLVEFPGAPPPVEVSTG